MYVLKPRVTANPISTSIDNGRSFIITATTNGFVTAGELNLNKVCSSVCDQFSYLQSHLSWNV